jgi:myo-inositol-1(or 4)-monophosphatase
MLEVAKDAARIGGEILKEAFGKLQESQIDLKGKGDYVTDLDHRSEAAILERIQEAFPEHDICAEESGLKDQDSSYQWVIDPLDGTANYVQGIPLYAISIALVKGDQILIGVIFHPDRDELFWAVKGKGAFLNSAPIRITQKKKMAYSMLASGFPWRSKQYVDQYLTCFKDLFLEAAGIRRMGSAALDLAYTACGRFDGFWEIKLGPWDVAAGILLVKEAGGIVTDFHGGKQYLKTGNVVAGNRIIHNHILKEVRAHLSHIH